MKKTNRKNQIVSIAHIHIPKTAGTTVNTMLNVRMKNHYTWEERFVQQNRNPEDYFVISFVRNPYDRLLSYYRYKKHKQQTGFEKTSLSKNIDFNDWVKEVYVYNNEKLFDWRIQKTMWDFVSYKDELKPQYIGRFENLQEDLKNIFEIINRPFPKILIKENTVSGSNSNYRSEYKDSTIEIATEFFKKDLETWGYSF
jgi:hypothetical protein